MVAGERNQGKSQLINALLDATVCAVGDGVTTPLATEIGHAETASAALVDTPPSGTASPGSGVAGSSVPVPVDSVHAITDGSGRQDLRLPVTRAGAVRVGLPHRLLASGFVLVDTPAVESETTVAASLRDADALLLVSDATGELSPAGLDLLRLAARDGCGVAVALTKTDLVPGWREVAGRCHEQAGAAGVAATVLPLAAPLRLRAARSGDAASNTESGYPALIDWLGRQHTAKREAGPRMAAAIATSAISALVTPLREGAEVAQGQQAVTDVNGEAQRRIEELRRTATRCQTMLSDEMTDLLADVEHDLRARTRAILHEAERVFERADPLSGWDEFAEWLRGNVSEAAQASFHWLLDRAEWIADRVAGEFHVPVEESGALALALPDDELEPARDPERPHLERFSIGQMAFTGMRGSYGGVLMFGLMTTVAGLPLVNPISLGAGAAFAGKSIHDEGESRLRRRQLAARGAAQRYVDDAFIQVNKRCKDVGKAAHRSLRDQLTEGTERAQENIRQAAARANRIAEESAQRQRRGASARQEQLQELAALYQRARALTGAGA